jgi:hypothetical protein
MSIEAMKQALEVLEQINQLSIGENAIALPGEIDGAMDNLRAAIEQAEKQEPVAWVLEWEVEDEEDEDDEPDRKLYDSERRCRLDAKREGGVCKPLYLTPPQRQWIGLTDEEAMQIWGEIIKYLPGEVRVKDFARAIEAKLKEKNHEH